MKNIIELLVSRPMPLLTGAASARNDFGQLDGGTKRTREGWRKWGEGRLTKAEKKLGWVAVVSAFSNENETYYRVNFGAQPTNYRQ